MKIFGLTIIEKSEKKRPVAISNLPKQRVRSYDAAAINRHTQNHWLFADGRDADSLIRQDLPTLRNRARYEIRNNSYAKGITDTKANDLIGTGPKLQIQTDDPDFDRELEDRFNQWAASCDVQGRMSFADILRLAGSLQQDESGEAFIILTNAERKTNWTRARPEPRLRLQVVEPDRVTTPLGLFGMGTGDFISAKFHDGIEFDEEGRPLFYHIMKRHPGSSFNLGTYFDYDKVPASQVIHLYKQDRPGQSRGVPWITPAIPLFAQLRRYTLATIQAAETAANISGTIETEPLTDADEVDAGDEVEIPRNALLTLPSGSKMAQIKPEQPASTYEAFKHEIVNEIARCLNMPFNVAAANSAKYNYASGRLDWQVYYRSIKTIRAWLEQHLCNRIFAAWLQEAMLIRGYLSRSRFDITPQWFWPGQEHIDPWKEARAQQIRLKNHTSNLAIEYASQGRDWEREVKQAVKEIELLKELGVLDDKDVKEEMEDIARAVRAGVPIGVSEARTSLGLPEETPEGKLLRFNDQDVLQYHIENGILEINEARAVLGLEAKPWGNVPIRKKGVSPVKTDGEIEKEEKDEDGI